MKSAKPSFDLINVMPSFLIGKNELVTNIKDITRGTNGPFLLAALGNIAETPNPSTTVYVNDVAKIEVLALDSSVEGNQNFLVSSGGIEGTTWNDALDIIRCNYPEAVKKGIFSLKGSQPTKRTKVDCSKAEKTFGFTLASYETQVKSVVDHYLELTGSGKEI